MSDRQISEKEADVLDLVLFLYMLGLRGHKDSVAVADVWLFLK
ncbi:putative phospholipid-transporting ATPase 9 [Iris pallida]|uniref:Phospholipid-transporting ATPase 9 n=1 Tax=Iris pallida TaxID=29817 RepID=A0AAX6FSR7_IRIPA|nr:putative phospholipid-transporting ATPase 9 [Iris pallida]